VETLDPWHKAHRISEPAALERGKRKREPGKSKKETNWFALDIGSFMMDWMDDEAERETLLIPESTLSTWPEVKAPKGEYR
jgi:hypothetical protein